MWCSIGQILIQSPEGSIFSQYTKITESKFKIVKNFLKEEQFFYSWTVSLIFQSVKDILKIQCFNGERKEEMQNRTIKHQLSTTEKHTIFLIEEEKERTCILARIK